jgi:hypothetical protein
MNQIVPRFKLTENQVRAIRERTHRRRKYYGEPLKVIAAEFGISLAYVCMIHAGTRKKL